MLDKHILLKSLRVPLKVRPAGFVGGIRKLTRVLQSYPEPAVLWAVSNFQPTWMMPCNWIGILYGDEANWRLSALLRIVSLVEHASFHDGAGRTVVLAGCNTLTGQYPLSSRNHFVANQPVAVVVPLEN